MIKRKVISRQIPLLILWLMASFLLWNFVLNLLTDTGPAHKIAVYADMAVPDGTGLAVELEKEKADAIRMIRVRPFTYAMMGGEELAHADLLIVPESDFGRYPDWFAPVPEALREGRTLYPSDAGEALGIRIAESSPPGKDFGWIRYEGTEPLYLAFGAHSLHLEGREGAADNEAAACAERLLTLLQNRP